MGWLASNKDTIGAISAIVSMLAVVFAAWQFYLARQVLEAEATNKALQQGRTIISQIERTPEIAASVYGVEKDTLLEHFFVSKVVSLYSAQFVSNQSDILGDEHWDIIKKELCEFYNLPKAKPIIDKQLQGGSYPDDFANVLRAC